MKEMLGGCCVCADENGWSTNPLVYCDGINCEVAVHQGCYGIVEVPDGEWLCAKCTAINSGQQLCAPRCELCPFGFGALKRTESNGWAHVICALYIPEVRFGDVHSMDPVIIADVPDERYQRHCYLCEELGNEERAALGACMSCNRPGCKKGFHVTCAQQRGLLCEEGGGSKNVKYCGYCSQHAKKAANDPSIKIIPPYRVRSSGLNGSSRSNESAAGKTTSATNGPSSTNAVQSHRNIRSSDQQLITDETAPRDGNSIDAKNHPHYSIAINRNNSKRSSPAKSSSSTANNLEMLAAASIVPCSSHVDDAVSTGSKEQQPSSLSSVVVQPSAESVVQTGTAAAAASSNNATTLMQSSLSNSIYATNGGGEGDQTIAGDCASADPLRPPSSGSQVISTNRQHSHDKLYDDDAICDRLLTRSPNRTTIDCSSSSTTDSAVATPLAYPSTSAGPKNSSGKRGRPPSCDNGALPSPHSVVKAETTTTTVDRIAGEKPPKRPRPSRSKQTVKALLELVNPVVQETVTDFQRDRVAAQQGAAAAAAAAALLSSAGTMPNTTTVSYQPSTSASMTHEYHHHAADSSNGITPIIGGAPPLRPTPKLGLISPEQQHDHQGFSGPSSLPFVSTTSNNPFPTSLEQLLERQWEQGSQFLMGQAQHFDIASLLSCLHQLKTENVRLEENMMQLASRRDHLLAVNARLSLALAPASTATSVNSTTSPHQSPRIIAAGTATSIHQQPSSSSIPHSATLTLASLGLPGMHHAMSVANVDNEPLSQLRTLATACGSSSSTANAASTNRISPSMMLMMTPSSSSSVLVNAAAVSNSQPTKSSSSSSQTTQANFSSSLHSGHQSSVNVSASPNTSTTGVGAFGSNTGVFSSVRIPHMPTAVASQQQQQQQQKQQQQRIDSPPSSIAGAAAGFLVPRTPLINPTTGNPLQSYSGLSPQDQILQQLMIAQHQQLLANAYSMHQQQQQQQQQQVVVTTGANQSRSSSSSTVSLTSSAPASGKTS